MRFALFRESSSILLFSVAKLLIYGNVKDDVLSFIAQMERSENDVLFYISGLKPVTLLDSERRAEAEQRNPRAAKKDNDVRAYIDACLKELARITETGDFLVIAQGTHGFDLQKYGFQLKAQTRHHFLYEKISNNII